MGYFHKLFPPTFWLGRFGKPTKNCKKGSVLTKCDHSRLIWSSTSADINKILYCTPFFRLKSKPKISGTDVKQREKAFPANLWV